MWLPPVDPAGSPRVGHKPSPRTARVENPYIPPKYKSQQRGAQSGAGDDSGNGYSHDDAAVPTVNSKVRMPLSARAPSTTLEGHSRSPRSASASASVGATPRGGTISQAMSDAINRAESKKRKERLVDSYGTAFSREQLLSEQYDKELVQVRERLMALAQEGLADQSKMALAKAERTKAKLERRVSGFESKLNELDTYNYKLVQMIDGLRRQNEPHRMATKKVAEQLDKMALDMTTQKAACHKALDERERIIDQIKHLQDDSHRDALDFEAQVEALKRDSAELDHANRDKEEVLEGASELEKRKICASMRRARAQKEKLEVRYGYLRSQLEGIDNDFRELQRIVGVHFQPSHPESLQQIIDTFVDKEQKVTSLQKYLALQQDEIETLSQQLGALDKDADAAQALSHAEASAAAQASASNGQRHVWEDEAMLEKLSAEFDALCAGFMRMFQAAGCANEPSGAYLATKGCSASTIPDFLSAIASRIDETGRRAYKLRAVGQAATSRSGRKPTPETINAFLTPRDHAAPAPEGAPSGADGGAEGGGEGGGAEGGATSKGPVVVSKQALVAKENLPSISDIGPEADGDADPAEGRRRKGQALKKGAIDREKRDSVIADWVARQQMVRGAQTARPTMREYYDAEEPKWPQRQVYAPASAR